jgi:5-methylcytosine-specific restriction protein A
MPSKPPTFRPPYGPRPWSNKRERKCEQDKHRPSSSARGYDKDWQEFRASFLKAFPRCSEFGCLFLATEVDHIKSIRKHPEFRLVASNCRSFCKSHHSARTARDQGFAGNNGNGRG